MPLNAKGFYVCAHCMTAFPETVDREGIRILGPGDSPRQCSLCKVPFLRGMVDKWQVDFCDTCRGILIPRRDFAELVRAVAPGLKARRRRPLCQRRRAPAEDQLSQMRLAHADRLGTMEAATSSSIGASAVISSGSITAS